MEKLSKKEFIKKVWDYYRKHGRHTLPWRNIRESLSADRQAYRILVSEVMLQQTQVERVVPRYKNFLRKFPSIQKLSEAPLGDVLREWQGLGYNRRAKMLHECAITITHNHRGLTPMIYEELMRLPGIGKYTAGAVMAFAYNKPVLIIETNIRTVVIHHFFSNDTDVLDTDILEIIERTLDTKNPREWYYALMDYGAYIKKEFGNPNTRSKHYIKQSPFKNSDRQIRGAILKILTETSATRKTFHKKLPFDIGRVDAQLERLTEEGMIVKLGQKYHLPK